VLNQYGLKSSQIHSQGCLYPYLEKKKLLDGSIAFYPRVIGERDPNNPTLWRWGYNWEERVDGIWKGRSIALNHHRNFSEYGCRIIQLTVQEVARLGFLGFPRRPDYLHASPVCANASLAHTAKAGIALETADDLSAAIAVAEAIQQLQPRVFTLENVPRYQNSQSFAIILNALEQEGYSVNYSVVNMADFGLPQARRRLVLIASKSFHVALPSSATPCGWYEAFTKCAEGIAHLIPTMPDSQLLPKQQQALEKFLAGNVPTPLLIERLGGRTQSKYKPGHLPCNTILRSHFTDHKGCNRSKFADIWLPDGTVKSLSIEGAAILQGFPSWYEFPNETATAGSIIGYSVPPSFATQLFMSAQSILKAAIV
jgi:DNA (cytosine-5)-methyltransferase 1